MMRRSGAVLLVTALGLATMGALPPREGSAAKPRLAAIAAALGNRRAIEPRVSGGFAWAALPTAARGLGGLSTGTWAIAAAIEGEEDPHILGVAHLLLGDSEEAVRRLERAADERPQHGDILSDLAAALIERGMKRHSGLDFVRALDLAERARTLVPDRAEPSFNAALALEKLGLHRAAAGAWDACRRRDRDPAWGAEAQSRADRLREPTTEADWDMAALARAFSGDLEASVDLVRRHPQEAFRFLVEELDRVTDLFLSGDASAPRALDLVSRGGRAMRLALNDSLVEGAARELAMAARGSVRLQQLADARHDLRRGLVVQDQLRAAEASALLRSAAEEFARLGSPFRTPARLYQLSAEFYLAHPPDFAAQLEDLVREADTLGHRIVASRARWLRGLDLAVSGHPLPALPLFESAARQLRALGFLSDATAVTALQASTWWTLGRADQAWEARLAVFPDIALVHDPRRVKDLLSESATQTELDGFPFAALALQHAAMQYASDKDTPVDRCESFVWLARTAGRAGRADLAGEAVRQARSELGKVADASMKARLEAELSLAEAHLDLKTKPVHAVAAADRALRWMEGTDRQNQRVECYLIRGRGHERQGELDLALADYLSGLRTAEEQRARIDDLALRISFFDTVFELGRSLVKLELDRGNPLRALLLADRVRATTLPSAASWDVLDASEDGARLPSLVPAQGAVVFFSLLNDFTAAWVLRRDGVRQVSIRGGAEDLAREVRAWRDAVARRDERVADELGAGLFDRLLAPLRPMLDNARTVIVVPDGVLHLVSWGSLRDVATGHRWIEEVSLGVAPSLRSLVPPTLSPKARDLRPATLVGEPTFDPLLFPNLPALPAAVREVHELEALYPGAWVLERAEATPASVLEAAARSSILHVAAHAMVHPTDADESALLLARGSEDADDGRLTAKRIRSHDLQNLDLVVLAACRTGDGPMSVSEGPLGVARAFLAAGARSVIVSLWDIPDEATRRWSVALHRRMTQGLPAAQALQRVAVDCWRGPQASVEACGAMQLVSRQPYWRPAS